MLRSPGDLMEGVRNYLRGDDSLEADAAADVVGETLLLHRLWLLSKFKR